jgi:hypothetical protein
VTPHLPAIILLVQSRKRSVAGGRAPRSHAYPRPRIVPEFPGFPLTANLTACMITTERSEYSYSWAASRKRETVDPEGLVMASEAQMPAKRRNEGNPPQRHRGHRDGPEFIYELGFRFILRALRVSVVRIRAKQSQFAPGCINANRCPERRLWEKRADGASVKTKPICPAGRKVGMARPPRRRRGLRAKQSQSRGGQTSDNCCPGRRLWERTVAGSPVKTKPICRPVLSS